MYLFAGFIPMLVSGLALYSIDIYPGGSSTILIHDLKKIIVPEFSYLFNSKDGFNGLFYSMASSLGGGHFGTLVFYLSPLNLILYLFPEDKIYYGVYLLCLLKVGLCGSCFCFYIDHSDHSKMGFWGKLIFSCSYALMSYVLIYMHFVIWLDSVFLFPVLVLFLERMVKKGNVFPFVLVLFADIILNYYLAYMSIIALTLYLLYYLSDKGLGIVNNAKIFTEYCFSGVLSAGMASFIIFPVILDYRRGKLAESVLDDYPLFKNSVWDCVRAMLPDAYDTISYN